MAEGVEDATAAALGNTGLGAWLALAWRSGLQPGETVLVLGATGACGSVAVQAAKLLGAGRVVAAARASERLERLLDRGADAVVELDAHDDLPAALRDAAGGDVHVTVDTLWGARSGPEITEAAVQAALVQRLTMPDLGWTLKAAGSLARDDDAVLVETEVIGALTRLNPAVSDLPSRVDEVLPKLRAAVLGVRDDGLIEANRRMLSWLRGHETVRFSGTETFVPIRLVDFEHPRANRLVVSTEVTYHPGTEERRYDLVLWVNGFPLVVGETKTPISTHDLVAQRRQATSTSATRSRRPGSSSRTSCRSRPRARSSATARSASRPRCGCRGRGRPTICSCPGSRRSSARPSCCSRPELLLDILRTYTLYSRRSLDRRRVHDQGDPALPAGRGGRGDRRPGSRPRTDARVWSGTTRARARRC